MKLDWIGLNWIGLKWLGMVNLGLRDWLELKPYLPEPQGPSLSGGKASLPLTGREHDAPAQQRAEGQQHALQLGAAAADGADDDGLRHERVLELWFATIWVC